MDEKTDLEKFLAILGEKNADGKIIIPKSPPITIFFFKDNVSSFQRFLRLTHVLGKKAKESVLCRYRVFLRTARVLGGKTLVLSADRQQILEGYDWKDVGLPSKTIRFRLALKKITVCENEPHLYRINPSPGKKHLLVYF